MISDGCVLCYSAWSFEESGQCTLVLVGGSLIRTSKNDIKIKSQEYKVRGESPWWQWGDSARVHGGRPAGRNRAHTARGELCKQLYNGSWGWVSQTFNVFSTCVK